MEYQSVIYYREKLTATQRRVYDALVRQWMGMEPVITLPARTERLSDVARAVLYDYPMLFYINYYELSYSSSVLGVWLKGDYLYPRSEVRALFTQCERWGRGCVAEIPAYAAAEERAFRLAAMLCRSVTYGGRDLSAHNLVGVIRDSRAVCEGISKAYKFLCDLAGIPCIVVAGEADGQPHSWNKLWLGRGPVFADVTSLLSEPVSPEALRRSGTMARSYRWDRGLVPDVAG